MLKKRLMVFFISLSLILSVGCSSSNTNTKENAAKSDSKNNNQSNSAEIINLDFWAWAPNDAEWEIAKKAFEKKYPNIKVNYIRYSSQEYAKKIKVAIQAGEAPDVMGFELSSAKNYVSVLEPLAAYAEKSWGKDWKNQFKSDPLAQVEDLDYKLLPTGVSVTPVIVYNAEMFKKAGVQPPKTLDDLKNVIKKFEQANLDGVIPRLGFPGGKASSFNDLYFNILNQVAPGKLYQAAEGKIKFTDPDLVKGTEIFKSLYTDKIVQDGNLTVKFSPQLTDMFFKGKKFPMIAVGAWTLNWIQQHQKEGTYGIIPIPSMVDGAKPVVLVSADLPLGINKDSKHKDAAWKFIDFMANGDYQDIEAKSLIFLPIKKGMGMDASLLENEISKEGAQTVAELSEKNVGGKRFLPYPELTEAIYLYVQKVATGELTPQKAMEEIQKVSESVKR